MAAKNTLRASLRDQGVDFDALPDDERFALLHALIGKEVTLMLKRLRKMLPAGSLRHVVVVERHKDEEGWLHYHLLLHEVFTAFPIRHKFLAGSARENINPAWPLGFSKWKLVEANGQFSTKAQAAFYVAKYLSKDGALARVRASIQYGSGHTTFMS